MKLTRIFLWILIGVGIVKSATFLYSHNDYANAQYYRGESSTAGSDQISGGFGYGQCGTEIGGGGGFPCGLFSPRIKCQVPCGNGQFPFADPCGHWGETGPPNDCESYVCNNVIDVKRYGHSGCLNKEICVGGLIDGAPPLPAINPPNGVNYCIDELFCNSITGLWYNHPGCPGRHCLQVDHDQIGGACHYWCGGIYSTSTVGHPGCPSTWLHECKVNLGNPEASDCSWRCDGIWTGEAGVCTDHGTCEEHNVCDCDSGYTGTFCEIDGCYGIAGDNTTYVCSGHGSCIATDDCDCDTGYTGDECGIPICYGTPANEAAACSNNGTCLAPDDCDCDSGWTGDECEVPICYGIDANNVSVCNSNGDCLLPDTCVCDTGYTGDQCEDWTCNGIDSDDSAVCSNNGTCTAYDTCVCNSEWTGDDCEIPICYGIDADDEAVCSSGGTCVDPDLCVCETGHSGDDCEVWSCGGIGNDEDPDDYLCNGHGTCVGFDDCSCLDGWIGDECETFNGTVRTCDNTGEVLGFRGTPLDPMPLKLRFHQSLVVGTELYVLGGEIVNNVGFVLSVEDRVRVYDLSTMVIWSSATSMPTPKIRFAACGVGSKIYTFGGESIIESFIDSLEIYNTNTDTWSLGPPMSQPLSRLSCAVVGNDIYLFGGLGLGGVVDTLQIYNTVSNSYSTGTAIPTPLYDMGVQAVGNTVYVFGGLNVGVTNVMYTYDTITDDYTLSVPMNTARFGMAVFKTDTAIYVLGGQISGIKGEYFDLITKTWHPNDIFETLEGLLFTSARYQNNIYIIGGSEISTGTFDRVLRLELTYMQCFGTGCNDDSACADHGTCVGTDTCVCDYGWTGRDCSDPILNIVCENTTDQCPIQLVDTYYCYGIEFNESTVCNENGICTNEDECSCNDYATGDECETPLCPDGCVNGNCESPNHCECDPGWVGSACNEPDCIVDCGYHQECVSGVCQCDSGYDNFPACDVPVCDPVCGLLETCVSPNVCEQLDKPYILCEVEETWECGGIDKDDPSVCGGYGCCNAPNLCNYRRRDNPDSDWMYGVGGLLKGGGACDVFPECNNKQNGPSWNDNGCGDGRCTCDAFWSGSHCFIHEVADVCNGFVHTDQFVCSRHGNCVPGTKPSPSDPSTPVTPAVCSCASGYSGDNCEIWQCDGIDKTNTSYVCNGHGTCVDTDNCDCDCPYSDDLHPFCEIAAEVNLTVILPIDCPVCENCTDVPDCPPVCDPECVHGLCVNGTCQCEAGWGIPSSGCDDPICTLPCQNGGTCTNPDHCVCPSGWVGIDCSDVNCDPVCGVHEQCSGPNTCTCDDGWSGVDCLTPICDSPTCVTNQVCVAPDTCVCEAGWQGDCSIPICSACDPFHATCTGVETCECEAGYDDVNADGSECVPICDTPVCGTHEVCTAPNVCECAPGFELVLGVCETNCDPECGANEECLILTNDPTTTFVCKCESGYFNDTDGGGYACYPGCEPYQCNTATEHCCAPDTCCCNDGFYFDIGEDACLPDCTGIGGCTDPNEECVAPDVCGCTEDWTGVDCDIPICNPTCHPDKEFCDLDLTCKCTPFWTGPSCDDPVCDPTCTPGNNKLCVAPGECVCAAGYYLEPSTDTCEEVFTCDGIASYEPTVCSGFGDCVADETCVCDKGYEPDGSGGCQIIECNGLAWDHPNVCGGKGKCDITTGTCDCCDVWSGSNCQIPECPSGCGIHGTCTGPNECTCDSGWTGEDCSEFQCTTECPTHSYCSAADTCTCDPGWSGVNCDVPVCSSCDSLIEDCVGPETCACKDGLIAPECTEPADECDEICPYPYTNYPDCDIVRRDPWGIPATKVGSCGRYRYYWWRRQTRGWVTEDCTCGTYGGEYQCRCTCECFDRFWGPRCQWNRPPCRPGCSTPNCYTP